MPALHWFPWSQSLQLKPETMWWRYGLLFGCWMHLHTFSHLTFLVNLTGHIGILCNTKWSSWSCQPPYWQSDLSFMCNSSHWVIYLKIILFCLSYVLIYTSSSLIASFYLLIASTFYFYHSSQIIIFYFQKIELLLSRSW